MYGLFLTVTFFGMLLKNAHNVAHLLVSAVRIVKLDVRQKNEEFAKGSKAK